MMTFTKAEIGAIKLAANDKITGLLDMLGVMYTERYRYVHAMCPIHNGDRPDGWSWHLDFGIYQCFSRGCHVKHGKDIFGLIMGMKNLQFMDSVKTVRSMLGMDQFEIRRAVEEMQNRQFVDLAKRKPKVSKIYPEESLKSLVYHSYLESRGFTRDIIESYQIGIGQDNYKKMANRIIFPIRNIDGQIVGFTGRSIDDRKPKWIHSIGFDKENNLFNIDRAVKHIKASGTVILTEGPIDVLRLEQAGIHNGVAILGRSITNGQMNLLMKAGVASIIFALDDDMAGRTGAERGIEVTSSFFNVSNVIIGEGKDIGDLTVSQTKEKFGGLV